MLDVDPDDVVERLKEFQAAVRDMVVRGHGGVGLHDVSRSSSADTIYTIDTHVEPMLELFCEQWSKETPLVLIAEGLQGTDGQEVESRVFPQGAREQDARIRVIVDPIDGTRGIMYDKRSAWALAGVAPNNGPATRLRDIEVAVMTELPTSKMGQGDVLWAVKGRGAHGARVDLQSHNAAVFQFSPSKAKSLAHGFASVVNFFPGIKRVSADAMESIAVALLGPADVSKAQIFDDQYISTGGQFYELIVGHDRFIGDLRPLFYQQLKMAEGLCCHPYDCCCWLIAEEAGVILTNGLGHPLDGPLDTTTGIAWAGYANVVLQRQIEPALLAFLQRIADSTIKAPTI
jgi:fructose-1,6-bisphosphatase/inositol monophosphatase family enzyme